MNKPSYIIDIPADEYHAATKANEYLSSHRLNLFRRCPALYIKHVRGEIVEGETQSFLIGRATHSLVLEGREAFACEFMVGDGPINLKTGKPYGTTTEKFREWSAAQEKPVITTADFELMGKMREAVLAHEKAAEILSDGFAEGTIRTVWNEKPIQTRMDWYDPDRGILADLKTCQDIDRVQFDIRDFGYIHQLAFYAKAVELAGGSLPDCWIIAVEKREPFRVAVFNLTAYTIDAANNGTEGKLGKGNGPLIDELTACERTDVWPTRYEGFGIL